MGLCLKLSAPREKKVNAKKTISRGVAREEQRDETRSLSFLSFFSLSLLSLIVGGGRERECGVDNNKPGARVSKKKAKKCTEKASRFFSHLKSVLLDERRR